MICKTCGQQFVPHHHLAQHCRLSPHCRGEPAVYRFVCPDGRSYVGSRQNMRHRHKEGIVNGNWRVRAAFDRHPPETWSFEILEWLPPDCSKRERFKAEQRHIDRLETWSPEHGFNIYPAWWHGNGPAQRIGRQLRAEAMRESHGCAANFGKVREVR
jgi:hypothetical protein